MATKSEYIQKKGKPDMHDVAGPTHKGENEAIKDLDKVSKTLYPVSEKDIKILLESGTNSYNKLNKKLIKDLKKE